MKTLSRKVLLAVVVQFPYSSHVAIATLSPGLLAILANNVYDVTSIDFAAKLI